MSIYIQAFRRIASMMDEYDIGGNNEPNDQSDKDFLTTIWVVVTMAEKELENSQEPFAGPCAGAFINIKLWLKEYIEQWGGEEPEQFISYIRECIESADKKMMEKYGYIERE